MHLKLGDSLFQFLSETSGDQASLFKREMKGRREIFLMNSKQPLYYRSARTHVRSACTFYARAYYQSPMVIIHNMAMVISYSYLLYLLIILTYYTYLLYTIMFTVYAPFFTMTQIEHYRGGGGGGHH